MLSKLLFKLFGGGLLSQALSALIRHALSALSGVLLGLGISGEVVASWISSSEQLFLALGGLLIAYLMSLANKNKLL